MKKNQIVNLEITGMTAEGNGVGRVEGMAVFVPSTAVGDIIKCKIVKVLKSSCFGIIDEIIQPSLDRVKADCPVFAKCGGCCFRHISYNGEMTIKENIVRDAFVRLGKFDGNDFDFQEFFGCQNVDEYRNKGIYPVGEIDGKLVSGFYSKRSHRIVPYTQCRLQPAIFSEIVEWILKYCEENNISAYNEENQSGILRHIYLREGFHSGEIMLCLVVNKRVKLNDFGVKICEAFSEIKSVMMNINSKNTNVIMGNKNVHIAGKETISDCMCGNDITLSPHSFYQVNTEQAEKLYGFAKELATGGGAKLLLDLYCGAGTIGLSMADKFEKIIGVEVVEQAIENAIQNAKNSGISNAEFICGDAGIIAKKFAEDAIKPNVIVVDPPRKGCDELTLNSIVTMSPEKIVMISCNPATAARDCAFLREKGYSLVSVRGVDLFPRTGHVETVVLMSRNI